MLYPVYPNSVGDRARQAAINRGIAGALFLDEAITKHDD